MDGNMDEAGVWVFFLKTINSKNMELNELNLCLKEEKKGILKSDDFNHL